MLVDHTPISAIGSPAFQLFLFYKTTTDGVCIRGQQGGVGVKIYPLNLFMNISRGVRHFRQGSHRTPQCRRLHRARGGRALTFTNVWARGYREKKNSRQDTDRTVLTISKLLTKIVGLLLEPKSGGHDQIFSGATLPPLLRRNGAPTFKFVPAPLTSLP